MRKASFVLLGALVVVVVVIDAIAADLPTGPDFTNSLGMKFVRIEPGQFWMGTDVSNTPSIKPQLDRGDYDEAPRHKDMLLAAFDR